MKKVIFLLVVCFIAFATCKKDPAVEEKPKTPATDYMEYLTISRF